MKQSPDIDCIFLNAGIGGSENFAKPETLDLERFNYAIKINFTAHVALVHAFTPFLIAKDSPTSFILYVLYSLSRGICDADNVARVPVLVFSLRQL